jgi:CubicO group peptidase (beta-lactamase class C family)
MKSFASVLTVLGLFVPSLLFAQDTPAPKVGLHLATLQGDADTVRQHIEAGSDLDDKDAYGSSPLIIAATFGKTEVASLLIEAGADLSIRDNQGSMPLHIAAFFGYTEIVGTLLDAGADKFSRNMDGSTAQDIVATPFADDKAVYDQLAEALAPLGLVLDYDQIEASRPKILAMLRPTSEELAAVDYAPLEGVDWSVATPAEIGLDPMLVAELYHDASRLETLYGLLIVKDGRLIAEGYYHDDAGEQLSTRQSITKSYLSALFGIARDKGCLTDLDQRMIDYFPEFAEQIGDPRKAEITVRQLLQMRGGYPMEILSPEHHYALYFSDNWHWLPHLVDFPLHRDPGTGFGYSNVTSHLLGVILARACQTNLESYADQHLFEPTGATLAKWTTDPDGYNWGWGEVYVTARDMAKFGLLYLNDGLYQGQRVISADWIDDSLQAYTRDAWTTPKVGRYLYDIGYGYQWWSARAGQHQFDFAWGHGGQLIVLLDEYDMVIVTTADPLIHLDPLKDRGWDWELAIINVVGKFIKSLPVE